jgi:DNA-binding CsgD family transcriptional regulator
VLSEQLAAAWGGAGTVTVIEAAPGLGKTRLLEESSKIAARLSMQVGWGGGDRARLAVQIAPVLDALFGGETPLLDRSHLASLKAVADQPYWLLLELGELLEVRAREGPLLVCLDDLQWADLGSVSAVRGLTSQTVGSPIAWIVALRRGEAGGDRLRLVDALISDGATRLELTALERSAVAALAEDVVGGSPDETLLRTADAAGGNPLLVLDLLRGLTEEGALHIVGGSVGLRHPVLPHRLQDSTERRLAELPSRSRHAATVAAVLGRHFRFENLAMMLAQPPSQMLPVVAELEQADILVARGPEYAFRHDLVHQAVLRTLPAPATRALERQAAGVLLDAGAAPAEIALRMARSADVGDEVAIDILREASRTLAPSDPRMAYELVQSALALMPQGDARERELIKEIVLLMHLAGDSDAAYELADRASRTLPATEQAQLAVTMATMFSLPDGVRLAASRRVLSLEGVPDELRAIHTAFLSLNLAASGLLDEAQAADAEAERMAQDVGTDKAAEILAMSRVTLGAIEGDFGELLRRIGSFGILGDAPEQQAARRSLEWNEAYALSALDCLDDALAMINEGVRTAHRDHQGWVASRWELYRGPLLVQAGRLTDARAATEWIFEREMIDIPLRIPPDCQGLLALARVAQHTDDRELARRCEKIARDTLGAGASYECRRHVALLLILQALGRGDEEGLSEAFGLLHARRTESVLPLLGRENYDDPQAVRGALRIQALDIADLVIDQAQARADANPGAASLRASVAHARGLRDGALSELRSAARELTGGPRPLALASALEDVGALCTRIGSQDEAVDALGRALALYAGCDAVWDARRVRRRLRALGVRRRLVTIDRPDHGWAALTRTEREVAQLIGQGLTNKVVAERLFVSPNTVGTHARHVFVKLGVRSRAELAARITADTAT